MQDKNIYARVADAMQDVGAIGKDKRNGAQGFNFRGIDDVYNKLHNVMAKHRIFTAPEVIHSESQERTTAKGSTLIYRILTITYHFYTDDGSSLPVTVIGEGMDSGDKASNKAMSIAHKYALFQLFMIPTAETVDPDATTPPASTPATPELDLANRIKAEIAGIPDAPVADGFRADAAQAWTNKSLPELQAVYDRVVKTKKAMV